MRPLGRTEIIISAHPTSLAFNEYRQGEWGEAGPLPAILIRVGKRLP
jgi:hypothetical protein